MPRTVHTVHGGGGGAGSVVNANEDAFRSVRIRSGEANQLDETYALETGLEVTESEMQLYHGLKMTQQASDHVSSFLLSDPAGWLGTTSVDSSGYWGATIPSHTYLNLPAGRYYFDLFIQWCAGATGVAGFKPQDWEQVDAGFEYVLDPTGLGDLEDAFSAQVSETQFSFQITQNDKVRVSTDHTGVFAISQEGATANGGTIGVVPYWYFIDCVTACRMLRWNLGLYKIE